MNIITVKHQSTFSKKNKTKQNSITTVEWLYLLKKNYKYIATVIYVAPYAFRLLYNGVLES